MAETPDPLADWIATADAGNEAYIKRLALTDATVATMPSGDLRKALGALRAVLEFHQPGPFALLGALCPEHAACRNFSITSNEADRVAACPECSATVQRTCTHGIAAFWPCAEYRAISGELLGKGESDA